MCLEMFHCGRMKNGGANIVPAHGVGVSMEDSRTEDWTLNLTGVAWVDFYKWHQIELIVIKISLMGGNW